jgi:putative SOS response-associated peptidase YedK
MCGRYALHSLIEDIREHFGLFNEVEFRPRYNIPPSSRQPIVRCVDDRPELAICQWGFVPHWMKTDPKTRPINARAESLGEKPFFRDAFRKRRCLIPANGFFEWKRDGARKQPYYFRPADRELFAFAGLWDRWNRADGPLDTFAIITTGANDTMRPVHDRMPVILDPAQYDVWLESGDSAMLRPYTGNVDCFPISTHVNSPANDGPELIEKATG